MKFDSAKACVDELDRRCRVTSFEESSKEADRKMRRGLKQIRCTACMRYKFPDERCNFFVAEQQAREDGKHG